MDAIIPAQETRDFYTHIPQPLKLTLEIGNPAFIEVYSSVLLLFHKRFNWPPPVKIYEEDFWEIISVTSPWKKGKSYLYQPSQSMQAGDRTLLYVGEQQPLTLREPYQLPQSSPATVNVEKNGGLEDSINRSPAVDTEGLILEMQENMASLTAHLQALLPRWRCWRLMCGECELKFGARNYELKNKAGMYRAQLKVC
ncbi:hypothetical protein J6590_086996 [Homalodisca vitripennis]|nr:hypothetical protein J6590_086996 [Homalodisca vitripennis]